MDAPTQGRLYLYYHHNTTGECASAECGYFLVSQTVRANTLSMSIFFGEHLRDHDQWPIFITPSNKITTYLADGWFHRFGKCFTPSPLRRWSMRHTAQTLRQVQERPSASALPNLYSEFKWVLLQEGVATCEHNQPRIESTANQLWANGCWRNENWVRSWTNDDDGERTDKKPCASLGEVNSIRGVRYGEILWIFARASVWWAWNVFLI